MRRRGGALRNMGGVEQIKTLLFITLFISVAAILGVGMCLVGANTTGFKIVVVFVLLAVLPCYALR
jgi:hypothetical protein